MEKTSIKISIKLWEELMKRKAFGFTFEDVIWGMIENERDLENRLRQSNQI